MMENNIFDVKDHIEERVPKTDLDCVDEIADVVCLLEGLTNMFLDITEDSCSADDEKEMVIREAYKSIIIRETAWAMKRLEIVSNVLYADVRKRRD